MGRNDLCFCGSGKKQKKCTHIDIHEDSIIADLLRIYSKIDTRIEQHYKNKSNLPPCHKGCSKCCSDYFVISNIEFDLILREMNTWNKEKQLSIINKGLKVYHNFKEKNPKYTEILETNITGRNLNELLKDTKNMPEVQNLPCPFLDEEGFCIIYSVRPIICRCHGTAIYIKEFKNIPNFIQAEHNCGHIKKSYLFKEMCDLTDLFSEIRGFSELYSKKYDINVLRRERPIFFYFHYQFEKYNFGLNPVNYDLKFKSNKDNYVDFLCERNTK